jgi:hypothetical protein
MTPILMQIRGSNADHLLQPSKARPALSAPQALAAYLEW